MLEPGPQKERVLGGGPRHARRLRGLYRVQRSCERHVWKEVHEGSTNGAGRPHLKRKGFGMKERARAVRSRQGGKTENALDHGRGIERPYFKLRGGGGEGEVGKK